MTKEEFLDKEHAFVRGTDTDVVRFYHTTIMKIFDDIEKEKTMNDIYVLITQPCYRYYNFYKTEDEAKKELENFNQAYPDSYATIEKWDIVKFGNWVARSFEGVDSSLRHHIG